MKAKLFLIIAMIFSFLHAQNDKVRWNDLFSYNNVKFLQEVKGIIYCGTENGIFLFNPQSPTSDWIKLNKTNHLNNVGISAMAYDESSDALLVGYENGGLDLLHSGESTMVLDIKWNGFSGDKKINNIYIHDGIAFISGAFGIVSYDLSAEEFKETTRTNTVVVNDATVLDNKLYIATSDGIYSSDLSDKKLNNPNIGVWTHTNLGEDVSNIELFNNQIYYSVGNNLRSLNGFSQPYNLIEDLKFSNNQLIITQNDKVSVLGSNDYSMSDINFNTAISINNKIYGGSVKNGLIDFSSQLSYYPQGPTNNKSWSVITNKGKVWIAPGEMDSYFAPRGNEDGFSYFTGKTWRNFSKKELFNGNDFVQIAVDPTNNNHFVASSYYDQVDDDPSKAVGVIEIEMNDDNSIKTLNNITSPIPRLYRVAGSSFDAVGNLYISHTFTLSGNSDIEKGGTNHLIVRKNGNFSVHQRQLNVMSTALAPIIDNKYIYIPQARSGGVAVLRKDTFDVVGNVLRTGDQTLPTDNVWSSALDKTGNLWIGTQQGLAIVPGIESAADANNLKAELIVIMQDGIPEALLTDVGIYAIKVDNANRKWIATNGAGVYYVSDSGEETKLHFTTKNSPLPSDIVYDISIDESTGKVYFATEKGVVSYNGDVSSEVSDFKQAIAYPNPYRPTYKGNVTIKNLPNRALVKITDVVGSLIYETKADGGIVEWNTNNAKGKPVASGIYLVLMTNSDGTESKTLKIAVVR